LYMRSYADLFLSTWSTFWTIQ